MSALNILTLTWNASEKLSKLHDSLMPALNGIDYKWLIKDNGSKDDTIAVASSWPGNIKVYAYKDNRQNFSEGCNYLFNESMPDDDDYVMLLNNDVIFNDTSSIKNMISILEKDNDVGIVGARLLYTNTNKLQHCGVVFDQKHGFPTHYRTNQETDADAQKNRLFQVITGAVCITKAKYFRDAFTQNKSGILGMDENYHWAFDDVDLCLSIKYGMNKKVVYCGSTNIFHEESVSLKKNPVNKLFMSHNGQYLIKKWGKKFIMDLDKYEKDNKYNLYSPGK